MKTVAARNDFWPDIYVYLELEGPRNKIEVRV
jgi:hypothetical protein